MINNNGERTISHLIHIRAKQDPHKIAIKHKDAQINYADLVTQTDQVAKAFLKLGLKPKSVVAVAMDRSIKMSICLLSLLKAGITYLPIDPALPLERIDFLMKDIGVHALITSPKYKEYYSDFEPISFEEILRNGSQVTPDLIVTDTPADHLVYICFTSGSTGLPKGVGVSQQSLLNLLNYRLVSPGVGPSDNMLGLTTMSFDIAQEELYLPLIAGAQLTIIDQDEARDGFALLETVKAANITLMQATPYIWRMMLEAGWKEQLPIVAFCGGEALTKDLADQLLPRCKELWNMYGPTETTICAMVKKLSLTDEVISIGRPIANVAVYVLDRDLQKVVTGEEGELYISGVGVTNGYINRPELTADKFVLDQFSTNGEQKMYSTGDLVKELPNGEYQFIGRIDTQVKVRGYRIETEEIACQLKQHEAVKDALVIVYQDAVDNARLVAYLTLQPSHLNLANDQLENELKDALKKVLPEYMVPVDYVFISKMPLLSSGKINKEALPVPKIKNSNTAAYVAPTTELEKIITEIWISNIGINEIGVNDNFFDLGGNSMIAVKTKIQIEKATKVRLSPSILFKYPTIKLLAQLVANSSNEIYQSLIPIKASGSKIPLYMVHGIGLNVFTFKDMVAKMDDDQPVYGLQAVDIDRQMTPLDTIEKIAAFYNSEIISHNPNGPYAISGYSIGGVIAYEMVKQLIESGRDVKLLVMFDTAVQIPTHQYPLLKKIYGKGLRQFPKVRFRLQTLYREPVKTLSYLVNYYKNDFGILARKRMNRDLPDYMVKTMSLIKKAFYQYKLNPIDIHIDVFIAKKLFFLDDPEFLGWKTYAKGGVSTYHIAGGHDDLFYPPFDSEVAELLQKMLNKINER